MILGTLFWTIVICISSLVVVTCCVSNKEGWFGGMCLILSFFVYIQFVSHLKWCEVGFYVVHNLVSMVVYLFIYTAIGLIWSIIRYRILLLDMVKKQNKQYHSYHTPDMHKDDIIMWMLLWPFSVIDYVLGRLLKDLFNYIYKKALGIYTKVYHKVISNILNK